MQKVSAAKIDSTMKKDFLYITKRCVDLTSEELEQCSELFSKNYGKYSGKGDKQAGQHIKMGPKLYKNMYGNNQHMFVSLCYENSKLLGQAFFLRKEIPNKGTCTWVTQLVVHSLYRNRKIGSKLLHSAWGFSDYYAWGLATANAITIKTLESVTWRKVEPCHIAQNLDVIENIMEEIPFVNKDSIRLNKNQCQIFSDFYPELEKSNKEDKFQIYIKKLGEITPGNEWLAFTFADQAMSFTEEKFKRFLYFSEQQLNEAYSRMNMAEHGWAKLTNSEVDFLIKKLEIQPTQKILDLGCGQGRHILRFSELGFKKCYGIDFSEANIEKASETALQRGLIANFFEGDARKVHFTGLYDIILCLYDVIGSFRDEKENEKIIRNIKQSLKPGGKAVISVMNMELTDHIAMHKTSLKEKPTELLHLPPSNTMESTGDIFDPKYFLINTDDGLVYRKEQFRNNDMLSAEYLVADKRYTKDEICSKFEAQNLHILDVRYVQAGHWDAPLASTAPKAKEILLIVERK